MRKTHRTPALLATALLAAALLTGCGEPTAPGTHEGARAPAAPAAIVARTKLSIQAGRFLLNGAVTYPGRAAEGKLMNVRMVNSVFEDANRPSFDAAANTEEFVSRMPQYVALGVRGFTVSLQGGYPGYEGARNTAFTREGALRSGYLARVARVVERADALGAVIILSLYYQRQDQHLADEKAIRAGVVNTVDWVRSRGYRNVILEVVNEYGHIGFDHPVLRSDAGVASLVRLANDRYPALPVSASYLRAGLTTSQVASAADLLLVHLNAVSLSDVRARIRALRQAYPGKAVVCNEDARTGSAAASAASASVEAGGSYGLMVEDKNQRYPFYFNGRSDDPTAYDRYVALTQ